MSDGGVKTGMQGNKCDFCSTPDVRWEYRCEDYTTPTAPGAPPFGSLGSWGACEECHRLIDAGDQDGLARRSLVTWPEPLRNREEKRVVYGYIKRLHKGFWKLKVGPAIRLTPPIIETTNANERA